MTEAPSTTTRLPIADQRGIEEAEAAQVGQHQVVGLGEEGGDQRLATIGGMMKGELVAEGRLAGTRCAGDHERAANRDPPAEDRIEAGHPGLQSWRSRRSRCLSIAHHGASSAPSLPLRAHPPSAPRSGTRKESAG
jgi:hypothetical protein